MKIQLLLKFMYLVEIFSLIFTDSLTDDKTFQAMCQEVDEARDEVENKIDKLAIYLILKKVDDVTIIGCTSITQEKLQELKEQMD